jgi:hypothetical protein
MSGERTGVMIAVIGARIVVMTAATAAMTAKTAAPDPGCCADSAMDGPTTKPMARSPLSRRVQGR